MSFHRNERGDITVIALAAILLLLLLFIGYKAVENSKEPVKTTEDTSQESTGEETTTPSGSDGSEGLISASVVNARNTDRKNDAAKLATAAQEFVANNSGLLPTREDMSLVLKNIGFEHYATAEHADDVQEALQDDELILVVRGQCGPNGSAVQGASSRTMAVVYAVEQTDASFSSGCLDV